MDDQQSARRLRRRVADLSFKRLVLLMVGLILVLAGFTQVNIR